MDNTEKREENAKLKNLTPFKKGNQAAKGHGRPKGSVSIVSLIRKGIQAKYNLKEKDTGNVIRKSGVEFMVTRMIMDAIKGDRHARRDIMEYLEGKPKQTIDSHTSFDLGNMNLALLSDQELTLWETLITRMTSDNIDKDINDNREEGL